MLCGVLILQNIIPNRCIISTQVASPVGADVAGARANEVLFEIQAICMGVSF
jgi:hypothetical protein